MLFLVFVVKEDTCFRKEYKNVKGVKLKLLQLAAVSLLFGPYFQSVYHMTALDVAAESTEVKEDEVFLDEDYAKIEGRYIEKEETFEWHLAFEKKESANEGRIRLAIDTAAAGIGTVKNVRGTGFSSYDEDGEDLKVETIDGQEWYVGKFYSKEAETGTLVFETEKIPDVNEGELPLQVVVDERIASQELQENETDTEDSAENQRSEENETEELDAPIVPRGQALQRIQRRLFNGILERLGPTATQDPYEYIYPSGIAENDQHRYPRFTTNDYTKVLGNWSQSNEHYQGEKGSPYDGENLIDDSDYTIGGANWRNYDYAADNGSAASEEDVNVPAQTVQLWGDERNFENSYLDYNGAYIKKWVEPVPSNNPTADLHPEDATTLYNVYLDVIGSEKQEISPIDIVFVLDKSASMNEGTLEGGGQSKNAALIEAVNEISENLLSDPNMDIRIGMVNFYHNSTVINNQEQISSDIFPLTNDINRLTGSENTALNRTPIGGTPLTLGLKNGYETLYADNGGENRNPEKILIVVGDGTPTFSYAPIQTRSRTSIWGAWSSWSVMGDKIAIDRGDLFKNFETFSGNTSNAGFTYPVTYASDFDRPVNGTNVQYRYGEVKEGDDKATHWVGTGSASNDTNGSPTSQEKSSAINTVAYHHWLKNKYQENPPSIFSIGLGIDGSIAGRQRLDAIGRNVLKNIADLNDDGTTPRYYDANNKNDIITALEDISSTFKKTIQQATLYDETGFNVSPFGAGRSADIQFYHLDPGENGMKYQEPEIWDEARHGQAPPEVVATPTTYVGRENQAYKFSPISLGEGEMVRIKYQVKLDAGAQDGNFYAVNNMAYIQNLEDYENDVMNGRMYFPTSSIRYEHKDRNFQISKTGQDGEPLAGIEFALYDQNPDAGEVEPIETSRTTADGMAIFETKIPVLGDETGAVSDIFWIREIAGPARYQLVDETYQFQIKKYSSSGDTALGHYELVAANTSGVRVGGEEGSDPDSYYEGEYHKLPIVQNVNEDETDYEDLYVKLEMRNEFKPVHMNINKLIEGSTTPINGAEFELYQTDGSGLEIGTPVAKGISGANEADEEKGMLTFYSVNENGEYLLVEGEKVIHPIGEPDSFIHIDNEENANYAEYKIVESQSPEGFKEPDENDTWILRLYDNEAGTIQLRQTGEANWQYLTHSTDEEGRLWVEFTAYNMFDYREIRVRKLDHEGNPLDGAGFDIRKIGDSSFPLYRAYTGNPLEPEESKRLSEIGYFYLYTVGVEKYVDLEYSQPLRLSIGEYEVSESVAPNGYQLSDQVFQFALNEEGKFVIGETVIEDETDPLPEGYDIIDGVLQVTLEDELAPIDLELLKVDSISSRRLEGAEFSIEKQNSAGDYELIVGGLAPDPNDSSLFNALDLTEGFYRIKEVKSPDGYRKLPGYFILEISYREEPEVENDRVVPGKEAGTLKVEVSYYPNEEAETPDLQQELEYELLDTNRIRLRLSVGNDSENPLPATGGSGRLFYILLAAFFVALAGAAYGLHVRQSKKEGAR